MQFTYFDLEMAEKEKVARQVLYGPATTKIQHRTGSENSDWTINRFSFWPCICCKCCCASFTVLLKHVKAEQKEEDENNWRKNKRNMQMRVNLYWWSRREGRNVAEWERIVVGANYFFFSFKEVWLKDRILHAVIFLKTLSAELLPVSVTALASALHSTAQACVCELEPSPVPLISRMTTWLLGRAIVYSYYN